MRNRRVLPRAPSVAARPTDLYLLAGLPKEVVNATENFLATAYKGSVRVHAVPASSKDGKLYPQSNIDALLRVALKFIDRRMKNKPTAEPHPRSIFLLYVPAQDQDLLLTALDFCVFPVAMRKLAEFIDGRQCRHALKYCFEAVKAAMTIVSRDFQEIVQPRVKSRRSSESLLLPPENFEGRSGPIREFFVELTRETRSWADPYPDRELLRWFDSEDLPEFLRGGERKEIFRDTRKLVFPCARPSESHGLTPPVLLEEELRYLQHNLKTMFRFGAPLEEGFHHDVQLEKGQRIKGVKFRCSRLGCITVDATHANVYPNDYVRPGK